MAFGICLGFFNPLGYSLPRQHAIKGLQAAVDSGRPVSFVEVLRENEEPLPVPQGLAHHQTFFSEEFIFFKENIWNLAAKPLDTECFLFLDSDVYYRDPDWSEKIDCALEQYDVIQVFDTACWESRYNSNKFDEVRPAVLSVTTDTFFPDFRVHHPGFGFGIRADVFSQINGFFDKFPLGDGDTGFCAAFSNAASVMGLFRGSKSYRIVYGQLPYQRWRANIMSQRLSIGVPENLSIYHRWHGYRRHRQYNRKEREYLDFDLARPELLGYRDDGLLTYNYPQARVHKMWEDRHEDGVVVSPTRFVPKDS